MAQNGRKIRNGRLHFWTAKGVIVICALVLMSTLGACGRRGSPHPPDGASYPQQYPYGQ